MRLGRLLLESRYFLSPLAGYTNLPFRQAVRELGGLGLATTELVNARALMRNSDKSLDLIETCPADRPLSVQIFGADPVDMKNAAQWLESYGASAIDINMGCPVDKVTRTGAGSALMCDFGATCNLVQGVIEAVGIPVTVKMRLGWDEHNVTAPALCRELEQVGVAAVIIHGRTRAQGFSGGVNLDGIRAVVEAVDKMPVIGNGDIRTLEAAQQMFEVTGCAGIAIGRGALLNPWIFSQLCNWEATGDPRPLAGYDARLDFMSRHFHLLVGQRGERYACLTFRKVANWYCKVLKPGREIQQRLVMLESVVDFDAMTEQMRDRGPPPFWDRQIQEHIAVPKGPISHW